MPYPYLHWIFRILFVSPFNDQDEDLQIDIGIIVSAVYPWYDPIIFFRNIKQEKDFYVNLHRVKI